MTDFPDIAALGARLQRMAAETSRDGLPAFVGALEAAKALAWSRLIAPAQPTPQTEPLLTAEELAPVIKLPVHAVRDRARRGIIPSVSVGRYVRFQASAVIAALKVDSSGHRSVNPVRARKRRRDNGQCPNGVQMAGVEARQEVPRG